MFIQYIITNKNIYDINRLGGSALAQCYKQLGDNPPDLDNPAVLKSLFKVTQKLLKGMFSFMCYSRNIIKSNLKILKFILLSFAEKKLLSGHDISEGGFITTVLEMGIGGIRGVNIDLKAENVTDIEALFNEELGIVVEVAQNNLKYVINEYEHNGVNARLIGSVGKYGMDSPVGITYNLFSV